MKLTIKNIGPIKEANIEVNDITVIAGINGSGKTTIAKLLYAHWKSHGIVAKDTTDNLIANAICSRLEDINDYFRTTIRKKSFKSKIEARKLEYRELREFIELNDDFYTLVLKLISDINSTKEKFKIFNELLENKKIKTNYVLDQEDNSFIDEQKKDIYSYFKIIEENDAINDPFIKPFFLKEEFSTSEIKYNLTSTVVFNDVVLMGEYNSSKTYTSLKSIVNHIDDFSRLVRNPDKDDYSDDDYVRLAANKGKVEKARAIINEIIDGEFSFDKEKKEFIFTNNQGQAFTSINTANGVKTLGYFSQLLTLNFLTKGNLLVLDEPETSLHPAWQVKFAETLIRLHKEFDLKIVILSHSPYFIDAINQFSHKHRIEPNFYLLEEHNAKKTKKFIANPVNDKVHLIMEALDIGYDYIDQNTLHRD